MALHAKRFDQWLPVFGDDDHLRSYIVFNAWDGLRKHQIGRKPWRRVSRMVFSGISQFNPKLLHQLPALPQPTYTRPLYILFLVLPAGISFGFATVTLPYLLTQNGFSVAHTAD